MKKKAKHSKHDNEDSGPSSSTSSMTHTENTSTTEQQISMTSDESTAPIVTGNGGAHQQLEQIFWSKSTNEEEKTREEEFDEYLADLLL